MEIARGHFASRPFGIPLMGWKEILFRVWANLEKDHVALVSAGVAFYGLLALFPAITALIAVAGLALEPADVTRELQNAAAVLPDQAAAIILNQAAEVTGARESGLKLGAVIGFALALYSASRGVSSLIEGLNLAYDQPETRGYFFRLGLTLVLTICLILGVTLGLGATILTPALFSVVDLGPITEFLIGALRWAVLLGMTIVGISILYRFGPDRSSAKWRWLTPGAALACLLWLIASVAFSIYAENFSSYNESFGTLAGVIMLLMWLWISSFVILLGAEINGAAELQTSTDTTIGRDRPMGERGAVVADTPPPA